jgi:hypothetical protein
MQKKKGDKEINFSMSSMLKMTFQGFRNNDCDHFQFSLLLVVYVYSQLNKGTLSTQDLLQYV